MHFPLCCRRYNFLDNLYTYPAQTCIVAQSVGYDYNTVSLHACKWAASCCCILAAAGMQSLC